MRPPDGVSRLPGRDEVDAVVCLVLEVDEPPVRRGQLRAVGDGPLKEGRGVAVVVAAVDLPDASRAHGIGGRDAGQDGKPCTDVQELPAFLFGQDKLSDL